ncbi:MAG TPA: FkbM family methyltransferase [Albidovulum sp.]|uniref:FkbM family methyltransferase n=1 Tax=Albidovulum sp. TaxID=1872424 RepID=UPI001DE60452|nr:FkbM family methyltransferase [Paracoccaceae bacterium]MCB2117657.1 FkbM family methyltransferase [Paracoccaceae bacterium]MCB2160142.1 FkbM family methyltransferase [Paracoccaceae bacterium]MCC0046630.1 FkbM family methyltransferase [Defluviimonas sp.]HRV61998.1 FkbM family methyltransferase [Albidovulum sp.]
MAEVQAGAKRKKTTRDAAPEATAASEDAAAAQEAAAETGTLPALDNNAILTFLEDAVQSLYGELRHSTQALNRAAQILALGESRVLEIPYFDYPFRFRLPYVSTDRTMGAMLARCEFPNAANLASLALRLPRGGVFVDGGGFVGTTAAFFSQVCRADEIHVFEPQRILLPCLAENLAMNEVRGLHLHAAALMDEATRVGQGTFKPREIAATPYLRHQEGDYEGMTIDGLNLDRLDVIHLDFAGPKILALTGARAAIERFRPFIAIDTAGRDHKEVTEFLEPFGYEVAGLPASFLFYPKAD